MNFNLIGNKLKIAAKNISSKMLKGRTAVVESVADVADSPFISKGASDAMSSLGKAKISMNSATQNKISELVKESAKNPDMTPEEAYKAAKEVIAQTGHLSGKSAYGSAYIFKTTGKTSAEKAIEQAELKAKLLAKHGEKFKSKNKAADTFAQKAQELMSNDFNLQ